MGLKISGKTGHVVVDETALMVMVIMYVDFLEIPGSSKRVLFIIILLTRMDLF